MRSLLLGVLMLSALFSPSLGDWQAISGVLKQITASVNYVWGVTGGTYVYKCVQPCTGSWTYMAGKFLKQIDAGDEEVWGVSSDGKIWKRPVDGSGSWTLVDGQLNQVSASGNGYIWGVTSNGQVYKCKKRRIMDKCRWTT